MAKLTTDARNKLKSSSFALPGRRFPVPDKAHAANAKARATQGVNKGTLSPAQAATVRRRANAVLTGVTQDLNAADLGKRAVARANGSDNRNPKTPYQEDINSWKSNPTTGRTKSMPDSSGGKGRADDTGVGTNYKSQPKYGGTQAESSNKKAAVKVSGGTPETGKNFKNQEKLGGTGMGNGGKRYANGSSSHDSMKTMIRDH